MKCTHYFSFIDGTAEELGQSRYASSVYKIKQPGLRLSRPASSQGPDFKGNAWNSEIQHGTEIVGPVGM